MGGRQGGQTRILPSLGLDCSALSLVGEVSRDRGERRGRDGRVEIGKGRQEALQSTSVWRLVGIRQTCGAQKLRQSLQQGKAAPEGGVEEALC